MPVCLKEREREQTAKQSVYNSWLSFGVVLQFVAKRDASKQEGERALPARPMRQKKKNQPGTANTNTPQRGPSPLILYPSAPYFLRSSQFLPVPQRPRPPPPALSLGPQPNHPPPLIAPLSARNRPLRGCAALTLLKKGMQGRPRCPVAGRESTQLNSGSCPPGLRRVG